MKRAIDDGFDVRGFMYWTLIGAPLKLVTPPGSSRTRAYGHMRDSDRLMRCNVMLFICRMETVHDTCHLHVCVAAVLEPLARLTPCSLPADNFEWNFAWVRAPAVATTCLRLPLPYPPARKTRQNVARRSPTMLSGVNATSPPQCQLGSDDSLDHAMPGTSCSCGLTV